MHGVKIPVKVSSLLNRYSVITPKYRRTSSMPKLKKSTQTADIREMSQSVTPMSMTAYNISKPVLLLDNSVG